MNLAIRVMLSIIPAFFVECADGSAFQTRSDGAHFSTNTFEPASHEALKQSVGLLISDDGRMRNGNYVVRVSTLEEQLLPLKLSLTSNDSGVKSFLSTRPICADAPLTQRLLEEQVVLTKNRSTAFLIDRDDLISMLSLSVKSADYEGEWMLTAGHSFVEETGAFQPVLPAKVVFDHTDPDFETRHGPSLSSLSAEIGGGSLSISCSLAAYTSLPSSSVHTVNRLYFASSRNGVDIALFQIDDPDGLLRDRPKFRLRSEHVEGVDLFYGQSAMTAGYALGMTLRESTSGYLREYNTKQLYFDLTAFESSSGSPLMLMSNTQASVLEAYGVISKAYHKMFCLRLRDSATGEAKCTSFARNEKLSDATTKTIQNIAKYPDVSKDAACWALHETDNPEQELTTAISMSSIIDVLKQKLQSRLN